MTAIGDITYDFRKSLYEGSYTYLFKGKYSIEKLSFQTILDGKAFKIELIADRSFIQSLGGVGHLDKYQPGDKGSNLCITTRVLSGSIDSEMLKKLFDYLLPLIKQDPALYPLVKKINRLLQSLGRLYLDPIRMVAYCTDLDHALQELLESKSTATCTRYLEIQYNNLPANASKEHLEKLLSFGMAIPVGSHKDASETINKLLMEIKCKITPLELMSLVQLQGMLVLARSLRCPKEGIVELIQSFIHSKEKAAAAPPAYEPPAYGELGADYEHKNPPPSSSSSSLSSSSVSGLTSRLAFLSSSSPPPKNQAFSPIPKQAHSEQSEADLLIGFVKTYQYLKVQTENKKYIRCHNVAKLNLDQIMAEVKRLAFSPRSLLFYACVSSYWLNLTGDLCSTAPPAVQAAYDKAMAYESDSEQEGYEEEQGVRL
jgi:hypothetical protein